MTNSKIRTSKQFSISKAKRELNWIKGEGADFGKYKITRGEMAKEHTKRAAGAAWGKAERKFDITPSDGLS